MFDDVITELVRDVEAEWAVLVVDGTLLFVAQNTVSVIDLFELKKGQQWVGKVIKFSCPLLL